ncbi:hypothetical protein C8J57DRAFT_1417715 [Mycena rebaudengoi]|nr:hypothetical protein C8J57DRAFT_1417715 [Mycena rebaudengoi]
MSSRFASCDGSRISARVHLFFGALFCPFFSLRRRSSMNRLACISMVVALVLCEEVRAACAGSAQASPLYRLYSAGGTDHFYTPSKAEADGALAQQYKFEGVRTRVFTTQVPDSVRLWRAWSSIGSDHFYTTNEATARSTANYVVEDENPIYVYPTQLCGSIPFYRMYSSTDHFYTADPAERASLAGIGYTDEGIEGYVFAADVASDPGPDSDSASKSDPASKSTSASSGTSTSAKSDDAAGTTLFFAGPARTSKLDTLPTTSTTGGAFSRLHHLSTCAVPLVILVVLYAAVA